MTKFDLCHDVHPLMVTFAQAQPKRKGMTGAMRTKTMRTMKKRACVIMKGQQRVKCSPSSTRVRITWLMISAQFTSSIPSFDRDLNELDSGILGWHFLCENFFSTLSSHLVQ